MFDAMGQVLQVASISRNMLSLHRESLTPSPIKLSEMLDGVVSLVEETVAKGKRNIRVQHGSTKN